MISSAFIIIISLVLAACTAGPHDLGVSKAAWHKARAAQRQQMLANYRQLKNKKQRGTVYQGPDITVGLAGGRAMMSPFVDDFPYQPQQFTIKPGQCRQIKLKSINGRRSVALTACYNGLALNLDPSRYNLKKSKGTLRLAYNPVWRRGFTYRNLSSKGYAQLRKTNITITAIQHDDYSGA